MPYKCDVCDYACKQLDRLKTHKLNHSVKKLYQCDDCGYAFEQLRSLKEHKLNHHVGKLYKCEQLSFLKAHTLKHRSAKLTTNRCDVCDYACKQLVDLKTHEKLVHVGEKPHKCEACGYSCERLDDLKIHKLIHSIKPHRCNVCDYSCKRLSDMKTHKLVHSEEIPYKCNSCLYSCSRLGDFMKHKLGHFTKCNTAFTQTGEEKELQKNMEENSFQALKPHHSCIDCEYFTTSVLGLQHHLLKHSSSPVVAVGAKVI